MVSRLRDQMARLGGGGTDLTVASWQKFGEKMSKRFNTPPTFDFMYGPMNIEVVEKKARTITRTKKTDVGKAVAPEKIVDQAGQQAESTSGRVQVLKEYLEKKKNINFIDAITDKSSFSRTVENVFYLSFLLKDGQARIGGNTRGDISIQASQPPDVKDFKEGSATQNHSIVKMDYETWMRH
eukprot:gene13246-15566_t